jgi:type I restriction enzyme M protein
VIANDPEKARTTCEKAEAELADLQTRIAPLGAEINQLGRQFWVDKKEVLKNKYDLSASRYRHLEQEEVFYEQPAITLDRMWQLEQAAATEITTLEQMCVKSTLEHT